MTPSQKRAQSQRRYGHDVYQLSEIMFEVGRIFVFFSLTWFLKKCTSIFLPVVVNCSKQLRIDSRVFRFVGSRSFITRSSDVIRRRFRFLQYGSCFTPTIQQSRALLNQVKPYWCFCCPPIIGHWTAVWHTRNPRPPFYRTRTRCWTNSKYARNHGNQRNCTR